MKITLTPIGRVVKGLPQDKNSSWNRWSEESVIEIDQQLAPALKGLEEYSHIFVIYWMHLAEYDSSRLITRPRGRGDLPEVGLLAFRGRNRPNPIGLSVCELIELKGNIITVRGLDAYVGTPVLDLKPYDYYDVVKRPKVPAWALKLWEEGVGRRPSWVGP